MEKVKLFFARYWEVLFHCGVLLFIFFSLWTQWVTTWANTGFGEKFTTTYASINFLIMFYVNVFWLIPKFLKPPRWIPYLVSLVTALVIIAGLGEFVSSRLDASGGEPIHAIMVLGGLLFSFAYTFTRDWVLNLGLIESLRKEKQSMELAYLKSQVDPHFLFNTLNSLYALALEEKGEKTADAIAKLGTLMRYNLHDTTNERLPLKKEVDYIEKYIELQKLRLTDKSQIEFHSGIPETDYNRYKIAPMLLIPFIENAFKYGVSPTENSRISIWLSIDKGAFRMTVKNTIITMPGRDSTSGVGLTNVRNRLDLLYPDKHELKIENNNNLFTADLKIALDT